MTILREVAAGAGPALAAHAVPDPGPDRFDGRIEDPARRFTLEAVHEGYLMHYGAPRAFAGLDEDLRLLGGDALYALGLERVAAAGDVAAVAELSDLISLCAQAQAAGRPDVAGELWEATALALAGAGPGARAAARDRLPAP